MKPQEIFHIIYQIAKLFLRHGPRNGKRFITFSSKRNQETKKSTAYARFTYRSATGRPSYVYKWLTNRYLTCLRMTLSILTNGVESPDVLQLILLYKPSKRWTIVE